ncbi:hypothetical protein AVEN_93320-2, partial [Araneus ventricosus]
MPRAKKIQTDEVMKIWQLKAEDTNSKLRYPKRNVPKKCYVTKKDNVEDEDEFLSCDICEKEYKGSCPVHGAMLQVLDTQ